MLQTDDKGRVYHLELPQFLVGRGFPFVPDRFRDMLPPIMEDKARA